MIVESKRAENHESRRDLVIIGNGMVSHALCEKLLESDAAENYNIFVFGKENRPAYDRVNLTKMFAGQTAADLELAGRDWYAQNNIQLSLGDPVETIDADRGFVETRTGRQQHYDRLVIATGSIPFVPPIEGIEESGVFVYRTIEDIKAIQEYSGQVDSAAVLGGGLLGLEAAKALYDLKLDTHVVEMAPALMPRQLDADGGKQLQGHIEDLGLHIHLIKRTTRIAHCGDEKTIHFDTGDTLKVGMVVVSAGIRPHNSLAQSGEIELGKRGGFVVNNFLETSQPNIYAIGECAEHNDTIYGLVAPGYQMADVLAANLAGDKAEFTSGDLSASLKLFGVDVATIGQQLGDTPDTSVVKAQFEGSYRKLILQNRKFVGAIAVGPWDESARVRQAIAAGTKVGGAQLSRFRRTGNLWNSTQSISTWPETAVVCSCKNITRGTLSDAMAAGVETVEGLAECTGASTVCGSCKSLLCELVGSDVPPAKSKPWSLLVTSAVALTLLFFWLGGPIAFSQSVQTTRHVIDVIWRDPFWKQVTGYTLLGFTVVGLLLPLRKRIERFSFGSYGFWRTMHSVVGVVTLVGLIIHTGMRMGSNLNFVLALVFLMLNLTGVFIAVVTAAEDRAGGEWGMKLRQYRPKLSLIHLCLFLPLPVLVTLHVVAVYFY